MNLKLARLKKEMPLFLPLIRKTKWGFFKMKPKKKR
jgi:hypothetical protein